MSIPPLDGMRIVEFGTYVAVPSGGMTLASLGADVIRIDPIGGATDTYRAPIELNGISIYWASMNKGKRSIMLDLRDPEGQELASAIATSPGPDAGFFVSNAVGSGWHDDEPLRRRREDLIWVRLEGYPDGRPALDYSVNWEVGFAAITGPGDSTSPTMHALPAWDLLAGLHVAMSLLAAERRRARSGLGASIRLSLLDVALWATDALGIFNEIEVLGAGRQRSGDFVYGTFGTSFETSDGDHIMLVALTVRQWLDLITLTGTEDAVAALEASTGEDLKDEHARWRQRERIRELLAPWFRARSAIEVRGLLSSSRLVWSGLSTFEEFVRGGALSGNVLHRRVHHPLLGTVSGLVHPARFVEDYERRLPVAPVLGADTEDILSSVLGLSSREVGVLVDRGIAAGAA
jgi:2-methylfumaryl-CoA isomerase